VSSVSGTESVVDVNVSEFREGSTELLDLFSVSLGLVTFLVFRRTLFFNVESQIFEEEDLTFFSVGDGLFDFGTDAVREESDVLAGEETFEFGGDGFERVFFYFLSVGSTEVRHEDEGVASSIESVLDGRESGSDTLEREEGKRERVSSRGGASTKPRLLSQSR
jgi:hypothetical protein